MAKIPGMAWKHGVMTESAGEESPDTPEALDQKKRWLRPEVRYTLSAVIFLFVFEYLLLPELASAVKSTVCTWGGSRGRSCGGKH